MTAIAALLVGALLGGLVGHALGHDAGVRLGRRTARAIDKDPAVASIARASRPHPITGAPGPERRA